MATSSPGLNAVVAEIMLDEAEFSTRIAVLKHIPGVSNVWPDALSRLEAPSPKHLPHELACVERTLCGPRDSDFWITMKAWKMQKNLAPLLRSSLGRPSPSTPSAHR